MQDVCIIIMTIYVGEQPGVFDHIVVNDTLDEAYKDLHDFLQQVILVASII